MKRLSNAEIEQWTDNDYALYFWAYDYFKVHKKSSMKSFIKENRQELTEYILNKMKR